LTLDAGKQQGLRALPSPGVKVFASAGATPRATLVAARLNKAYAYFNQLLGFRPTVALLVLSAEDHKARYGSDTYGLPFYRDGYLVLPAEASPAQAELARQAKKLSTDPVDQQRIDGYFELLDVYELAQAYTGQRLNTAATGKPWLNEYCAILMQYAYVAQQEPKLLPTVETLPRVVAFHDTTPYPHRTLADFASAVANPQNYAWYRNLLGLHAAEAYQTGGPAVVQRLYTFLLNNPSNDLLGANAAMATRLEKEISPAVAGIITTWPAQ